MVVNSLFHFFGGKGGVGKTTCAAAAAIASAEAGSRTLIVSTDPAHSLGDALTKKLSAKPQRITVHRGELFATELDATSALKRWLTPRRKTLRTIAERGTVLDDEDIDRLLQLSLPGVDELIGLLELVRLARAGDYETIVVDTAPTGHTLRFLEMPETLHRIAVVLDEMQERHRFVRESLGGAPRADAADALIDELESDAQELAAILRNRTRTTVTWVLLPEALAVAESQDALAALQRDSIAVNEVIVNRVTARPRTPCALCDGRRSAERVAIGDAVKTLTVAQRALRQIESMEAEPRGVAALRRVATKIRDVEVTASRTKTNGRTKAARTKTIPLLGAGLEIPSSVQLLFLGGKGGVGKTTCAAATALAQAEHDPQRKILLLSTDPAHSLGDALGIPLGDDERNVPGVANLFARELDAARAFDARRERYRDAIDGFFDRLRGESRFDASHDRNVMQDLFDLAPPGLDELFAVVSVCDALVPAVGKTAPGAFDRVIIDTAPTGHALRLLEMPELALTWSRTLLSLLLKYRGAMPLGDLARELTDLTRGLREVGVLLRDSARTQFVPVMRAAELPRVETERLLRALKKLHIPVPLVIVNALTPPGCARCDRLAVLEEKLLTRFPATLIRAPAIVPPPIGLAVLRNWEMTWKTD